MLLRVNSSVVRDDSGELTVVLHEERYARELAPAITALESARDVTTNESLGAYLDAKIDELRTGSKEAVWKSDLAWLNLSGDVDFVIGTAVENYLDRLMGVRGNAQAVVCRVNDTYQGFCDDFIEMLPELEERAPWHHKKVVDADNLPLLRFVDAITWSGGYDMFPATVAAESLPNDQRFRETEGSVNLVFANVQEAIMDGGDKTYIRDEFIPRTEIERYGDELGYMGLIMTAVHEMGHASGGVAIDVQPNDHFGTEYSRMEEARAELFSMWALPILTEKGVITPDQEVAGFYSMLVSMTGALQNAPEDHSGSRNMMFHYFLETGALVETPEDGKVKYTVNPDVMRSSVEDMLGLMGNIRATGDKEALAEFKSEYLRTNQREEFEERLKDRPDGRLLIFPEMEIQDGKYTGNVTYAEAFRDQPRTLNNFL